MKRAKTIKSIPTGFREYVMDISRYLKDNYPKLYEILNGIELYSLWCECFDKLNPSEVDEDNIEFFVEWLGE